jgi:hypothetical protein
MEEELIYEIVDCIINNQDKIKELTHKIKHPEENEIYKKEMQYKNSLNSNIKRINKYENEIKINDKIFKEFANKFYAKSDKIDDEISIISEKLNEFDKNNKNKDLYKASYEKFKNMILNKKDKENLKYSKNKLSKINAKNIAISKDMKIIEEERNKLKEIDLMLDEDKNGIDIKIVDYMSLKESYEEIAKQYLKKFILNNINDNMENNNVLINENIESYPINENNDMTNIILYSYELNCIDSTKIENEISNQIIYLINNYIKETKDDNNDIMDIKSYDKMIKSEDDKNLVNFLENKENNKLFNSIINKTKLYYNKQEIISLTSILSSKIRKKLIEYFISTNDYIKNKHKDENLDNLLIILKDLIISFINIYFPSFINKNEINHDLLILYIKCAIKSFYYQKIISDDFTFLNDEYKKSKKIIKKNLSFIEKEYNNIQNKNEEYSIAKDELEEKMKYLYDNINNNNYEDLTPEEKEYIVLNQRLDELNISKKKLKYDFLKYENEIYYNLEKLSYKIEQLKANNKPLRKNILTCQEEIKSINNHNKLEIKKLEKSIKDKYNVIKGQISVYKKKYGDNMELYNKLVGRINGTLKETDIENNNLNDDNCDKYNNYNKNNNYLSDRNSLYNTQSTFYKSNEKQNLKNRFFSPQKSQMNYYNNKIYFY